MLPITWLLTWAQVALLVTMNVLADMLLDDQALKQEMMACAGAGRQTGVLVPACNPYCHCALLRLKHLHSNTVCTQVTSLAQCNTAPTLDLSCKALLRCCFDASRSRCWKHRCAVRRVQVFAHNTRRCMLTQ